MVRDVYYIHSNLYVLILANHHGAHRKNFRFLKVDRLNSLGHDAHGIWFKPFGLLSRCTWSRGSRNDCVCRRTYQLNDVSQFLFGKAFGKRKIVPAVSPNKTWAGFLGGVFVTTGLALLLFPLLTPYTWPFALFAGLIISIFGFIGDVNVSALKRDLGVKDSGQALPGHGGILDRIDSLTYTAPLVFHFTSYFYF